MDEEDDWNSNSDDERIPKELVFTYDDGQAIPIHLHRSLGRGGSKALAAKIEASGGDPSVVEEDAEVIICRNDQPIFKQLEFKYDHHRYVWVEPPSWVDMCIMNGIYEHIPPGRGNKPHRDRVAFTAEDDRHLVDFLARRIPFKNSGGRIGNGVYKDLCDPERADTYPWAIRHSWQSWRERYVKNQDTFDPHITRAVNRDPDPPDPGGKGQYTIPRKQKKVHLRHAVQYDSEMEEEEAEEEEEEVTEVLEKVSGKRRRPEDDLRRRRRLSGRRRSSVSPPRKQPRIHSNGSESEDEDAHPGRDQGKGKGHPDNLESDQDWEAPEDEGLTNGNDAFYDSNEAGPSQFAGQSAQSSPPPAPVKATHGPAVPTSKPSKVPVPSNLGKEVIAPPPARKTGAARPVPPAAQPMASSSKRPPDSQRTVIGQSQGYRDPGTAPPDTQATRVPSSPPPPQQQPPQRAPTRRAVQEVPAPQQVYRNTRARAQSLSVEPAPVVQPSGPTPKRSRGRPRKVQQPEAPSEALLPSIGEESQQFGPLQAPLGVSFRDEAQVEEILHVDASQGENIGGGSSSSSEESNSSDDDQAVNQLRDAQHELLRRVHPAGQSGRSSAGSTSAKLLPYIKFGSPKRAGSPSRKVTLFQGSTKIRGGDTTSVPEADANVTPRPKSAPRMRAAKKTAAREPPHPPSEESDTDIQSEVQTETTESSFPAGMPLTDARQYKNAQAPFTPARGTKAEERVRSERTAKGKGKAR